MNGRALVVGAGVSGLLAASVLSGYFRQVTVIDADRLPDDPVARRGTPQGHHSHGLWGRGLRVMNALLPGIVDELVDAGATPLSLGSTLIVVNGFDCTPRGATSLDAMTSTRWLLESVIRRRVRELPGVTLVEGSRAEGLVIERGGAIGVRVRSTTDRTVPPRTMAGTFVVDASGGGSRAPQWLQVAGFGTPEETVIDAHLTYATRIFCPPADHSGIWKTCIVGRGLGDTRAGVLLAIEGGRWLITLTGVGDDRPSGADNDFLPFARGLASPVIAEAIATAQPVTSTIINNSTVNRRRYFERLRRWPENFVVMGDAACRFNPVYAQGMTNAALTAELLAACLAKSVDRKDLRGFAHGFQRRLGRLNDNCWAISTSLDHSFPTTEGAKPDRYEKLFAWYINRAAKSTDPKVRRLVTDVLTVEEPPRSLMHPAIAVRVLASGLGRASPLSGDGCGARRALRL